MNKFKYDLLDSLDGIDFPMPDEGEWGDCCGAGTLYGFPTDSLSSLVSQCKRALNEQWRYDCSEFSTYRKQPALPSNRTIAKYFTDRVKKDLGTLGDGRVYSAILISSQLWIAPILKDLKFRLVSDKVRNKNTGNILYVYIRDTVPKQKKVKKSIWS